MSDCTVCLNPITAETGKAILACGHEFHMKCVCHWLDECENENCPMCRHELTDKERFPGGKYGIIINRPTLVEILVSHGGQPINVKTWKYILENECDFYSAYWPDEDPEYSDDKDIADFSLSTLNKILGFQGGTPLSEEEYAVLQEKYKAKD